jgi:hypothetical protein
MDAKTAMYPHLAARLRGKFATLLWLQPLDGKCKLFAISTQALEIGRLNFSFNVAITRVFHR